MPVPATTSTTAPRSGAGQRAQAQFGNGKLFSISETVNPTTIVANGTSTSVATATVTCVVVGVCSNPDTTAMVTFTSSDPAEQVSSTTNNGDGTYSATITSSTKLETATITASTPDIGAAGNDTATASLTQVVGPAAKITETVTPVSIPADGKSTSKVTADVTDTAGHPIVGDTVAFASSDTGERVATTVNHGDGSYSTIVTASKVAGTATISATDTSVTPAIHASASLTQTPLPATAIHLVVSPNTEPADGTSVATLSATVTNELGAGVSGQHVIFSSTDAGQLIGPVTDPTGVYTAPDRASTNPGTSTITATDTSVTPHLVTTAVLTETPLPPPSTTTTTTTAAPTSSVLPFTGSDATRMSEFAAALLAAGGGLIALVRRRRPQGTHHTER